MKLEKFGKIIYE